MGRRDGKAWETKLEIGLTPGRPASPKTTKLYDRTSDQITLDEVERIVIVEPISRTARWGKV
jgi:hypothetical protein